ncbi:MAG TPA: hypothetical protein DDW27_11375 [Bacteroidales bacterium]|nr:hypothetical protein [Bacteroidales bacterium]
MCQSRAEVKSTQDVPVLYIDGNPYPPFAYMSYLGEEKYYRQIAATGIHLYCFPAYMGERGINAGSGIGPFRTHVWTGENQYDFSSIITDFEKIITADPKAKIIIRFYLDAPLWWEKINPDASTHLPDGSTFRQCFVSEKWRRETGKALEDCLDWLLSSPYSKYLIGIHVAAGGTEEWFYHARQRDDRNPVRTEEFRKWLTVKYNGDVMKLRKAWNDNQISFIDAEPGNINEGRNNRWRDPALERRLIDTYHFHSEVLEENIEYFCRTVKETSNRRLLTGAFYGYHFYVTDPGMGHGALAKLLECKDLDYLSSPNTYNRVIGEDWLPMLAIKSVQMHGKLWLAENDTRTSITTLLKEKAPDIAPPGQYESGVWLGPEDMKTSVAFLWKNAGRMLAYGYGGWWFDMWGGWFSHPELLNVIGKTLDLYNSYPQSDGGKMKPQVCVVYDEHLCFLDASNGSLTEQILSNRYPLGKTGTSYDLLLRPDLNKIPTDQYKAVWLLGLTDLSEDEMLLIKKLRESGTTVLLTDKGGTNIIRGNQDVFVKDKITWTDSQLRKIFENAGVHVYIKSGDVFYAGRSWLCIHTIAGGERTISLPFMARVINPVENTVLSEKTDELKVNFESKSTLLLRLEIL